MPKVNQRTNRDGTTTYFVRTRDAEGRQTSEPFRARREAEAFAKRVAVVDGPATVSEKHRRDRIHADYVPTLTEWLTHHVAHLTGVTDRTKLDYLAIGRRTFLPVLGDHPLDAITRADVADFVNAMERAGLSAKIVRRVLECEAKRIVYVSCNATTMAPNARQIVDAGYRLTRVRPVDMFPQTPHIECVALFEKTAGAATATEGGD